MIPPTPPALGLLPIEVNGTAFRNTLRYTFKQGVPLADLIPYLHNLCTQARDTASKLPSLLLEPAGESHYTSTINLLQTLKRWREFLIRVHLEASPTPELSAKDHSLLAPLEQLEGETQAFLNQVLPRVLQKREQTQQLWETTFKQSVQKMQDKTAQLIKKLATSYQLVNPLTYACAEQLIIGFFAQFLEQADAITLFITSHLHEWNTLSLTEGRALWIAQPESLPCSFLFSTEGNCYALVESAEHLLGKGSEKIVYRAIGLPDGEIYAIIKPTLVAELIDPEKKDQRHKGQLVNMWTESELLFRLQKQPGIIQIKERMVFEIEDKKQLFLIEDYYWDGSLHDYFAYTIRNTKAQGLLSAQKKHKIMQQLLQGLIAIHKAGITHHDIKPDNVLLDDSEEEIQAVLADFQLAADINDKYRLDMLRCRAAWAPPEYVHLKLDKNPDKRFSAIDPKPLDIWSLGIVFYILATASWPEWVKRKKRKPSAKTPLEEKKEPPVDMKSEVDEEELQTAQSVIALTEGWLPESARNSPYFPLLSKMLQIDPTQRCTAEEALVLLGADPLLTMDA